jgi:hypothetical protein
VPIAIDYEAGQNRNGCRSGDHEVPTHSRLSRLQFVVTRSRNDRQGCNVACHHQGEGGQADACWPGARQCSDAAQRTAAPPPALKHPGRWSMAGGGPKDRPARRERDDVSWADPLAAL